MKWIEYCWTNSKDLANAKLARLHIFLSLLITGDLPKIKLPAKMTPKMVHTCLQVKPKGFVAIGRVRANPNWTSESLPYRMEDKEVMVIELISPLEVKCIDKSNKEFLLQIENLLPCSQTPLSNIDDYNY